MARNSFSLISTLEVSIARLIPDLKFFRFGEINSRLLLNSISVPYNTALGAFLQVYSSSAVSGFDVRSIGPSKYLKKNETAINSPVFG